MACFDEFDVFNSHTANQMYKKMYAYTTNGYILVLYRILSKFNRRNSLKRLCSQKKF